MDILLKSENGFDYFLLSPDSAWWEKLVENGYKHNFDFVPPLTHRMPMEDIFNRFRNENAFAIVASCNNSFAGCFCCYHKHPVHHKATIQFVLIAEEYRNKKITDVFFDLAFEIFRKNGCSLIESTTWSTNYQSQKVFARNGFYLKRVIENERGEGIHTLVFEKRLDDIGPA
jgi:ribosomal protein S18 acetylase RimI-like enzyme